MTDEKKVIWEDRKRNFLGLPWTFTRYELCKHYLRIHTGMLNSKIDKVMLYRITDVTVTRNLWQKIIGTGTLHVDSADQTMRNFDISNIKDVMEVEEEFSKLVEEARMKNRVYMRENMAGAGVASPIDSDGDGIPDFMDDNDDRENH